jgi:hypothetical protein
MFIKIKRFAKITRKQSFIMLTVALMVAMGVVFAVSANTDGGTPAAFNLNFDVSAMFAWAQTIISALMPVVYITMGLGLGFLIINALKRAFH